MIIIIIEDVNFTKRGFEGHSSTTETLKVLTQLKLEAKITVCSKSIKTSIKYLRPTGNDREEQYPKKPCELTSPTNEIHRL